MPIVATQGSGVNYAPAPAGAHPAVCVDVVDLGVLKVSYAGKEKSQHKVNIVWQIEELRDDGKAFEVRKRYTLSLHEKAGLRKDLESWRGRQFSPAELEGFDLENLLGIGCLINIVHAPGKDGGTFANVASIMKMPKGMATPKPIGYTRVCDREPDPNQAQPESPEWTVSDSDVPF